MARSRRGSVKDAGAEGDKGGEEEKKPLYEVGWNLMSVMRSDGQMRTSKAARCAPNRSPPRFSRAFPPALTASRPFPRFHLTATVCRRV